MSQIKANSVVGRGRLELPTNGLKVRSEQPSNQSDGTRSIYGVRSGKAHSAAVRAGYFTEAATGILFAVALLAGAGSARAEQTDIPLQKCSFPYKLAAHATVSRFCAGPPPVLSVRSGNDRVLVSVSRHTDRPLGAVIVIHNPSHEPRAGTAVVEFF